ncbi:MAG: NAD-dependent epimerase/dehydratase family protein [Thermodesulfobium sp.]
MITGGAGFIGSHLCDLLIEKGHKVVAIDNLSLGREENISHLLKNKNFEFIKADLLNFENVKDTFEKYKFEAVFHLAANSDIQNSAKNPKIDLDNTFMTTWNTLECCRLFGVKEFVFASTSAIYGESDKRLNEDFGPLFPVSYYGAGKLASEAFISSYSYMNNIQSWIVRFPNVVGERTTHGVIHDFIAKLRNNPSELEILGNGKQRKPYIYVKDLVEAIFFIYENSKDRLNYFNVGVEDQTTVDEIAQIICEEMGLRNVKFKYTGGNVGWKGDIPEFKYDLSKIHALGWKANYSSNEAAKIAVRRILGK